jgi:D-alanine-D-alanine ligase
MVTEMTTPQRVRVAVVFGGRSTEHAISCVSAGSVLDALDPDEFEAVPVGITRDGQWCHQPPGDRRREAARDNRRVRYRRDAAR